MNFIINLGLICEYVVYRGYLGCMIDFLRGIWGVGISLNQLWQVLMLCVV